MVSDADAPDADAANVTAANVTAANVTAANVTAANAASILKAYPSASGSEIVSLASIAQSYGESSSLLYRHIEKATVAHKKTGASYASAVREHRAAADAARACSALAEEWSLLANQIASKNETALAEMAIDSSPEDVTRQINKVDVSRERSVLVAGFLQEAKVSEQSEARDLEKAVAVADLMFSLQEGMGWGAISTAVTSFQNVVFEKMREEFAERAAEGVAVPVQNEVNELTRQKDELKKLLKEAKEAALCVKASIALANVILPEVGWQRSAGAGPSAPASGAGPSAPASGAGPSATASGAGPSASAPGAGAGPSASASASGAGPSAPGPGFGSGAGPSAPGAGGAGEAAPDEGERRVRQRTE
jgi:hypothetical protein